MQDIRTMRRRPRGRIDKSSVSIVLLALMLPAAALGEDNRAAARLEAMASFLAKAPSLSVVVDCAYDVVQDSGEKIEFGERREMVLRRPDRARIDVARRDGLHRGLLFDGKDLTVFDVEQKVYATVPKPGTIDAAFTYFTRDLNMRLPLRELFSTTLPQDLKDVVGKARLVAQNKLGQVETDHIAFRGDTADIQVWIARSGDPLPQRLVITYRLAEGQPQFEADFSAWNLKPDVPDSLFAFTPAEGAERIPILAPGRPEPAKKQP